MEYFFSRLMLHTRSIWKHRWLAIAMAWLAGGAGFIMIRTLLSRPSAAHPDRRQVRAIEVIGRRQAARLPGDLSASTELRNVRIADPPSAPEAPSGPKRSMLYSMALLAALAALFVLYGALAAIR